MKIKTKKKEHKHKRKLLRKAQSLTKGRKKKKIIII